MIAWDRMRWLNDPMNSRFPSFVCCCATWLTGMVIALPYPIYTTYLDLGVSILTSCNLHSFISFIPIPFINLIDRFYFYTYITTTIGFGTTLIHISNKFTKFFFSSENRMNDWIRKNLFLFPLQMYIPRFRDVGMCVVNLVDDSQEYMRGLFLLM